MKKAFFKTTFFLILILLILVALFLIIFIQKHKKVEPEVALSEKIDNLAERLAEEGWDELKRKEMEEIVPLGAETNKELFAKSREYCLNKCWSIKKDQSNLEEKNKLMLLEKSEVYSRIKKHIQKIDDLEDAKALYTVCKAIIEEKKSLCDELEEGEEEGKLGGRFCREQYLIVYDFFFSLLTKKNCAESQEEIKLCSQLKNISAEECSLFCEAATEKKAVDVEKITDEQIKYLSLALAKNDVSFCDLIKDKEGIAEWRSKKKACKKIFYLFKAVLEKNKDYLEQIDFDENYYYLAALKKFSLGDFFCEDYFSKEAMADLSFDYPYEVCCLHCLENFPTLPEE